MTTDRQGMTGVFLSASLTRAWFSTTDLSVSAGTSRIEAETSEKNCDAPPGDPLGARRGAIVPAPFRPEPWPAPGVSRGGAPGGPGHGRLPLRAGARPEGRAREPRGSR